jgi:hypothetical protein
MGNEVEIVAAALARLERHGQLAAVQARHPQAPIRGTAVPATIAAKAIGREVLRRAAAVDELTAQDRLVLLARLNADANTAHAMPPALIATTGLNETQVAAARARLEAHGLLPAPAIPGDGTLALTDEDYRSPDAPPDAADGA